MVLGIDGIIFFICLLIVHAMCIIPVGTIVCKSVVKYNAKHVLKCDAPINIEWGNIGKEIKYFLLLLISTIVIVWYFDYKPWVIWLAIILSCVEFLLMLFYAFYFCFFKEDE